MQIVTSAWRGETSALDSDTAAIYPKAMDVTQDIDAIGLLCPWPVLKAQKALRDMASGEVLCLMATDPVAFIDVPHFCEQEGHSLLEVEEDGSSVRYYIQKA